MNGGRRLLAVVGTTLALAGCGTTSQFCTTIGCIGSVTVTLDPSFTERIAGPGTVRVCLADICSEQPVGARPGQVVVSLAGTELDVDTADLTVDVVADGTPLVSGSTALAGDRINGPGCPPACYQSKVTITDADITA